MYGNETHNTENSKTVEPYKFVRNLLESLDLRSSNKHVVLQNLSIYYTWRNIRQQYKNNSLNYLMVFVHSVSNIQDYIKYIIKKYKTLTTNHLLIFTYLQD